MEGDHGSTSQGEKKEDQIPIRQKETKEMHERETDQDAVSQELRETLQTKQENLAGLDEHKACVLPDKMLAFSIENQREKRLMTLYELWKFQARKTRQELKSEVTDNQMTLLADELETKRDNVIKAYTKLRAQGKPEPVVRRKVDACVTVTNDIMKILNERLTGVNGEYDAEQERRRLHLLLEPDYQSINGSRHSRASAKRAKEAEIKMILTEKRQREKIRALKEKHRCELDKYKAELEQLQAERVLKVAPARREAYDREITAVRPHPPISQFPVRDVSRLAQALQDSMAINRLPIPKPTVFNSNPMDFLEWKALFMSLVDRKNIPPSDKLHYLKRYVGGAAQQCVEGTFYRSDSDAYSDAWNKLNQRFGHPFIIQKAFREKLANWPKIQTRDAEGLRHFSDFLNACLLAIPHVKGLEILNDYQENETLTRKLPEGLASRWNRQVAVCLSERKDFPSFKEFTKFMSLEAEIACNPVTY